MGEWLERFGYDADGLRTVAGSNPDWAIWHLVNTLCHASIKWVPVSSQEMILQQREYRIYIS